MTQPARAGFLASAKSLVTIGAVVVYGGLFMSKMRDGNQSAVTGWDYIFPLVSDPLWITLIPLTWLLIWILPRAIASSRDIELVRAGSHKKLLLVEMAYIFGAFFAFLFLLCACFFGIASQLGIEFNWSSDALKNSGQFSAYSASHFATWFSTPIEAVLSTSFFSILGLISIVQLIMTIAITGHLRVTVLVSAALWLWLLISSFSPFSLPLFFDGSIVISLGWALSNPAGVPLAICWWSIFWLTSAFILSISKVGQHLKAYASERLWVAICCLALAFVMSLNAVLKANHSFVSYISQFFTGPLTDLVGYLLQAAIPLSISTALLSRLIEIKNGFHDFQLIRLGNTNTWIRKEATREIFWAVVTIAALLPLIVILGIFNFGLPDAMSISNLFLGLFGLFSVTTLQIALVFAIFLLFQNTSAVWMGFVAIALFCGFWFPNLTSWITFIVPESVGDMLQSNNHAWPAELMALVISAVLFGFLLYQSKIMTGLIENKNKMEENK